MEINKRQFKKWIAALRSGDYKQTTGTLHNTKGYCCLGVACDVLVPKKHIELDAFGFLVGGLPEEQVYAPQWLMDINDDFDTVTESCVLSDLNDGVKKSSISKSTNVKNIRFTFDEIADILELVYTYKAFKE